MQVSGAVAVFLCFSMHPGTHLSSSISYVLLGKINFPLALKSYDSALFPMSKSGHGREGGSGVSLGEEEVLGFWALSELCYKFVSF